MLTQSEKTQMQATLDQRWMDLERFVERCGDDFLQNVFASLGNVKPLSAQIHTAQSCVALVAMQIIYNKVTREEGDENANETGTNKD